MRLSANSRLKRSNFDSLTGACFPLGISIPFVFISAIISFLTYPLKFRFLTKSNIARSIALFVLNATGFGNLWRSFKSNHLYIIWYYRYYRFMHEKCRIFARHRVEKLSAVCTLLAYAEDARCVRVPIKRKRPSRRYVVHSVMLLLVINFSLRQSLSVF